MADERNAAEIGEPYALLRMAAEGSVEAFDRLYALTAPMVKAVAIGITGDAMEAEDVCHDVFLQLIAHPERYDPNRGSLEAWLAVSAKSRSLDRMRKRKRVLPADDWRLERADYGGEPSGRVLSKLESEAVRQALRELPGTQRQALAEAFYGNRTQRELAEQWQVPLGTVKSRIRYGLNHLRKTLIRLGWTESEGGEKHA